MTESEFSDAIADLARTFGWRIMAVRPAIKGTRGGWVTPWRYDGTGWPDLTLVHPDHGIIYAELKRSSSDKPTDEQLRWGEALKAAGARWFVWRPSDADQIAALLSNGRVTAWPLDKVHTS